MCAKSLKGARHIEKLVTSMPLLENSFKEGVFVGGMIFNEVQFSQRDMNLINLSDSSMPFAVPEIAFSFRSFWRPVQTPTGMLYRNGEYVVSQVDAHEYICQITNFLCLCSEGEFFKFVKVQKYSQAVDEEGTPLSDPYSRGLVIDTASAQELIIPVNVMLRKIILCNIYAQPDDENADRKIAVDFQRETPPISYHDILVPFYPQVNDMICIKGDEPNPWLAKVLTIQERAKTVKVWYYEEDIERPGEKLYVPYRDARQAQDSVSWGSILGLASGEWRSNVWKME